MNFFIILLVGMATTVCTHPLDTYVTGPCYPSNEYCFTYCGNRCHGFGFHLGNCVKVTVSRTVVCGPKSRYLCVCMKRIQPQKPVEPLQVPQNPVEPPLETQEILEQ